MNTAIFFTLFLGIISIFQAGFNRQMASHIGVVQAVFLGNFITMIIALAVFLCAKQYPHWFSEFFQARSSFEFKWWYSLPGIFGFFIVLGFPFAIYKVGAVKATILLVTAQMMTSFFWDMSVEKIPLTGYKILGLLFAGLSVFFLSWER
ncbi:MAG: DMT family transporter [Halobacteriovoraceae bacterium]|nr:DMT family transporter [Halobacteriovoraceae bacterium]